MISILFWVAVGALIGWNFPQPQWVKNTSDKIKSKLGL